MSVIKCKMCGGTVDFTLGETVGVCDFCGTKQTLPKANDEVITNLFNRANNLRLKCEFDKAEQIYEKIVQQDDSEAEAHWGIILCKYGIEYVEDPKTFERIPTCHRTRFESIKTDADYEAAIDYSEMLQQRIYEKEAREIDKHQKDILAIVKKEEPFDVFICYKETDDNGKRTVDSTLANDIYHHLTPNGLKVFYAAITLEDKLGQEYEPYIFAASNSAKVMLVIGTKPGYFTAVWVKNEWSRFMNLMKTDKSKILIPCYREMDAYDLPEEFAHLQAQDMSRIGFIQDIIRGVEKVVGKDSKSQAPVIEANVTLGPNVNALLKRGYMSLEDGDWDRAKDYFDQVLNIDAECGDAYLGMFMAIHGFGSKLALEKSVTEFACDYDLEHEKLFQRALRYSSEENSEYLEHIREEHKQQFVQKTGLLHKARNKRKEMPCSIYADGSITVGIRSDGTVVATGWNKDGRCNVSSWDNVIAAAIGSYHTIGLKQDGTVIATGSNNKRQCNVSDWTNMASIAAGSYNTIGLRSDGTVVATGWEEFGRCNVSDWTDINDIVSGGGVTVGLRSDGTVVATGNNQRGQCNVSDWKGIEKVSTGFGFTLGLRSDGTVVATGNNEYGQCNVSNWKGIVDVLACKGYSIGLRLDGTVLATGENSRGQCNVSNWTDVISIVAGFDFTMGLRSDGTVVATGVNSKRQCNVSNWTDVVSIAAGPRHAVGLRSDGTVLATGEDDTGENCTGQCNVSKWKLLITEEDKTNWYNKGILLIELSTVESLNEALELFDRLQGYKDSDELAKHIREKIKQIEEENKRREKALAKESFEKEREALITELNNLHGLFSGKRRNEIEIRLNEIKQELDQMQ